jgi:hypothetical protein
VDLEWRGDKKQTAKDLFGRPLRVALTAWVLDRGETSFYLQEAQDAMRLVGEAPSGVHKELRLLEMHGMLNSFPVNGRVYFTATTSPLWTAFDAVAQALGIRRSQFGPLPSS